MTVTFLHFDGSRKTVSFAPILKLVVFISDCSLN
jgi:hypothetical protein